nr:hypothetical protein [Tanacetum cinerariifolium]
HEIKLLGDETNMVPLYYHIVDNFQIKFGRKEFCLVTELRFGEEYSDDYENDEESIPFRRRVFPSSLNGKVIAGLEDRRRVSDWILRLLRREEMLIRKRIRCLDLLRHSRRKETTFSLKVPKRLLLMVIILLRQTGKTLMPSHPEYIESSKTGSSSKHVYAGSIYKFPPTTVVPEKRGDKTMNKGKNANLSAFNLGNTFNEDNVRWDDVMFLGEHDTSHCLLYENIDPNYFWRQLVPHVCMPGSHSLERANQEGWLSDDLGDSVIIFGSFDFEDCRIIYAWALEVEGGFVSSCRLLITISHPAAGSESRPSMLNKENYVPWSSRLLWYAKSRPNGKLIHNSILNGPYVRRMIPEPGDAERDVNVNETFHEQTDDEISERELKQIEADDQAIQTILLGLPEDIYAAEKKAKLFNEWERFTSNEGESIESYYHRFLKLMNDLKRNKHFMEKIASNLKFLNNLQPEWSRHVTIVHQTKDLHTADYTQLYDFLKYNQKEQASTSGTQTDSAPVYDSDGSAELVLKMIPEPGAANHEITVTETFHLQTDDELSDKELKQIEADDQAIQTILLGLPEDIYAVVDSWESIESYYHRFLKLMNDLKRNKHFPKKIASNLKFLNNLQPEWSRHVTIVHQTKDLHTTDYTQLYDFLKYNQKEVDELKAERLAKNQDPLALTANSNNPYVFPTAHQDQSSFNQNYLQQPISNPEDITDPTTAMNMALALMAKAFKLNYSTPTNNNQRITSNPRNRQIAQPRINIGNPAGYNDVIRNQNQIGNDNLVAARAEGNAAGQNGNQIRCYNCRGQASTSGTQTDSTPVYDTDGSAENDNDVISEDTSVEQGEETTEQHPANFEETSALYESLYQNLAIEVEKVNSVNYKLKETNADLTTELARYKNQKRCFEISQEKYDKLERCYQQSVYQEQCLSKKINALHLSTEETLQLAQESRDKMKQMNKEIKPTNYTKINHLSGVFVPQTALSREELYFLNNSKTATVSKSFSIPNEDLSDDTTPSVARKFLNKVKSTIVTLQRVVKQRMTIETHNWSSSAHQELHKIVGNEIFPIVNQVDARVQNFEIQFLKEAAKFVGDFKSFANEADASLAKHNALEFEIERLLKAVVSKDIMIIMQNEYVVDTSDLQTKLKRTKERFENCIIKKETEYAKLWNDWYKKCDECKYDKMSYDKAYKDMQQKIKWLQAQLGDLKGKSKDTSSVSDTQNPLSHKLKNENVELEFQDSSKNTKFTKQPIVENLPKIVETNALSNLVTSNSVSTPQESKGMNNDKVIASGMFRINTSKTSREEKHVPNTVSASARIKPITVSQPHVITKKDVHSDLNDLSSTGVDNTKTRRP